MLSITEISQIMLLHKKRFALLIFALILAFSGFLQRPVSAAGSAVITVEPSVTSVTAGGTLDLRFYVTPSGANVYSAYIYVTLTNMYFQSYDSTSVPFNGFAGITDGNSAGSTYFQISTSYQGASPGGAGKVYMGRVRVITGSAGSASAVLSASDAYDPNVDPMSPSSQNTSITVSAPASPPASCPSGQTGTPPNCSIPSTAPSSQTTTPSSTNASSQPNETSNATIPSSNSTSDNPTSELVTENSLNQLSQSELNSDKAQSDDENEELDYKSISMAVGGGLLGLLIIAILGSKLAKRHARTKEINRHIAPQATYSSATSTILPDPPSIDTKALAKPEVSPKSDDDSSNIIYPTA